MTFPFLRLFKFVISITRNLFIWNGITIKEKASVTIKNVGSSPFVGDAAAGKAMGGGGGNHPCNDN